MMIFLEIDGLIMMIKMRMRIIIVIFKRICLFLLLFIRNILYDNDLGILFILFIYYIIISIIMMG